MYALSPDFVSSFDWQQFEEINMIHELPFDDIYTNNNNKFSETETSPNSSSSSAQLQVFKNDDMHNSSVETKKASNPLKRSSHNEYERDRRKKLNKLYASLTELLPEKDQKKLSIPCSIARVLKYIPELKRNIEKMKRNKEELQLRSTKKETIFPGLSSNSLVDLVISATCLNKKEIMVQICAMNKSISFQFSKVARVLEGEGYGLLNVTTQTTGCNKTFYALHLQAKEEIRLGTGKFCEQLRTFLSDQTVRNNEVF